MVEDGGPSPVGRQTEEIAVAIYKQAFRFGSGSVGQAAEVLGLSVEEHDAGLRELIRLGLVTAGRDDPDVVTVVPPEIAIVRVLERDRETLTRYRDTIAATSESLERIVERFLPLGPGPRLDLEFEVIEDLARVAEMLDMMTDLGRDEMLSMHPGPLPPEHLLREGLARDRRLGERGLSLRALYVKQLTTTPYVATYLRELISFGYEIRTTTTLPIRMIICDARRALIPLDPTHGQAGAIAIDGEVMVRSLVRVFEHCWQDSSPLAGSLNEQPANQLTEQEHTVLRLLAVGMKDEQIGRAIGVSVRTVSRTVSDLMRRLGVQSRFQAGVRAAQAGWVE
ncbi:regulatory LuxR family protein [Micromonospora endolithica]|nr:regulatory LuxR family protein [Micromonospora endolithica]